MVASERPYVIGGRQWLIATDVTDPEKESEGGSVDGDGAALDGEGGSVLIEAGVSTGVTEVGKKEVE